jgi:tRNA U34 5-carboxymethylaminomethyl modifying GTPase MnmE/TrmE
VITSLPSMTHRLLSGRDELKSCLAHTEAVIDFGDDDRENDIDDGAMWALVPRVKVLRETIQKSLSDNKKGEILRDGVQITLVGLPNAGVPFLPSIQILLILSKENLRSSIL